MQPRFRKTKSRASSSLQSGMAKNEKNALSGARESLTPLFQLCRARPLASRRSGHVAIPAPIASLPPPGVPRSQDRQQNTYWVLLDKHGTQCGHVPASWSLMAGDIDRGHDRGLHTTKRWSDHNFGGVGLSARATARPPDAPPVRTPPLKAVRT